MRFIGEKNFFLTFLTFYTLCGSLGTITNKKASPINGERLVAVEHTMFIFDDLKVTSHDDKLTDKTTTKIPNSHHPSFTQRDKLN